MQYFPVTLVFIVLCIAASSYELYPKITVSILFRNKQEILDNFFYYFEELNYPKSQINLFLRCDNSFDETCDKVEKWSSFWKEYYSSVDELYHNEFEITEASLSTNWTSTRQSRVRNHMDDAMTFSKRTNSAFWFYLDADVLLINRDTLRILVGNSLSNRNILLIAPLINCPSRDDFYNFWLNIHPGNLTYALKNETRQNDIAARKERGVIKVGLVHSIFLMRMTRDLRTFNASSDPMPPEDKRFFPIISLINLLKLSNNLDKIYLDNRLFYGYFPTPVAHDSDPEFEIDAIMHMKLQIGAKYLSEAIKEKRLNRIAFNEIMMKSPHSHLSDPEMDYLENYGIREIYILNLDRRPERRKYMQYAFDVLHLRGRLVNSIDGQNLNKLLLKLLKIRQMSSYLDPSFKRPMTLGEVACFLSHYFVWQDIVDKNISRAMILEDDTRFSIFFNQGIKSALYDADSIVPDWDLLYLGRKALTKNETMVKDSKILINPNYSYWTIGYILNLSGAKKLLAQNPLQNMVPVDEYIPMMFNKHPNTNWSATFSPRNLIALATNPMLIEPLFYKGDDFYSSDTEKSELAFDFTEC